jgi:Nucleotidyl transferase AbiEii toxin, Type IV TA system
LFRPKLDILPPPQRTLWPELDATPDHFTLYGGTALALRIGHRQSADFDFFSPAAFDPVVLAREVPYLAGAETVQLESHTLTCRVDRKGPVLISFFGNLGLGMVAARDAIEGSKIHAASLLDIAGTKALTVQQRAQARDYLDIDALIRRGIDLRHLLAAGRVVWGRGFNPLITLKALSYFDDVPTLPAEVRERLRAAVAAVDPAPSGADPPSPARGRERADGMKTLPLTPELLRVAGRVVWFEEPARALADPVQFLAHAMVYGTIEDLAALRGIAGLDDYLEVLERAPPGIFDARSWAYWHLVCGRHPAPPLPVRAGLLPNHDRTS